LVFLLKDYRELEHSLLVYSTTVFKRLLVLPGFGPVAEVLLPEQKDLNTIRYSTGEAGKREGPKILG